MKDKPVTLGLNASFGFGDRIGLATPGHVAAMKRCGAGHRSHLPSAIDSRDDAHSAFASTSHARCDDRSAECRMGRRDRRRCRPFEDHLLMLMLPHPSASRFSPSIRPATVDQRADDYDETTLRAKFAEARSSANWFDKYVGKVITLSTGTRIELTEQACMRAARKVRARDRTRARARRVHRPCATNRISRA